MKYIALEWEEIDLGYNRFAYRPVRLIEGIYFPELDIFKTADGKEYSALDTGAPISDHYFTDACEKDYYFQKYGNDINAMEREIRSQFDNIILVGKKYNGMLSIYEHEFSVEHSRQQIEEQLAQKKSTKDPSDQTVEELFAKTSLNNEVAIKYREIDMGHNKYIYVPEDIVVGTYVEKESTFVDENLRLYHKLSTGEPVTEYPVIADLTDKFNLINEYGTDRRIWKEAMFLKLKDEFVFCRKVDGKMHVPCVTINVSDMKENVDVACGLVEREPESQLEEVEEDQKVEQVESVPTEVEEKKSEKLVRLKELRAKVLDTIKGEDLAVRAITTTIIKNNRAKDPHNKQHIFIAGPTGTGKTKTIDIICKEMGIPYKIVVATDYTSSGYVGDNVNQMIGALINACNGDIKKAENGILVIDEIDKKSPSLADGSDYIATKAVLDELLKFTDRRPIQITLNQNTRDEKTITFDTSNLTIICMGAFAEIFKKNRDKLPVGFVGPDTEERKITDSLLIEEGGMTPEFMGRMECLVIMRELTLTDFINIIKTSYGSQLKYAVQFYRDYNIDVQIDEDYYEAIAKVAYNMKVGARGIKKAIEASLKEIDNQILEEEEEIEQGKYKSLHITQATAYNPKEYYLS